MPCRRKLAFVTNASAASAIGNAAASSGDSAPLLPLLLPALPPLLPAPLLLALKRRTCNCHGCVRTQSCIPHSKAQFEGVWLGNLCCDFLIRNAVVRSTCTTKACASQAHRVSGSGAAGWLPPAAAPSSLPLSPPPSVESESLTELSDGLGSSVAGGRSSGDSTGLASPEASGSTSASLADPCTHEKSW